MVTYPEIVRLLDSYLYTVVMPTAINWRFPVKGFTYSPLVLLTIMDLSYVIVHYWLIRIWGEAGPQPNLRAPANTI